MLNVKFARYMKRENKSGLHQPKKNSTGAAQKSTTQKKF